MNTLSAFRQSQMKQGRELMVFDWDKAARIIKERKAQNASAGLSQDWEWTGGRILIDGKPSTGDYTYLSSNWAIPELQIDEDVIPCFIMASKTEWDANTNWPKSALKILED